MLGGWGQDECWEMLSEDDRAHLHDSGYTCCSSKDVADMRKKTQERSASWWWSRSGNREEQRMLTAINNRQMRSEFCRLYQQTYPGDQDTGCRMDQSPPATIVREQGDVPLVGPWPR